MLVIEIIPEVKRYMSMKRPTPGCFFACRNMVFIIVLFFPKKKQIKEEEKLTVKLWQSYPSVWMFVSWSTVCRSVQQNLLPISPCRSLPISIGWMRGSEGRGREGQCETVLILIITSVEDAVCFHWGLLGTRCPKLFCYTTIKLQVLKLIFLLTQQIQRHIF